RTIVGKSKAFRGEVAAADSFDRSYPRSSAGSDHADTASFSHQTTVVGIHRSSAAITHVSVTRLEPLLRSRHIPSSPDQGLPAMAEPRRFHSAFIGLRYTSIVRFAFQSWKLDFKRKTVLQV